MTSEEKEVIQELLKLEEALRALHTLGDAVDGTRAPDAEAQPLRNRMGRACDVTWDRLNMTLERYGRLLGPDRPERTDEEKQAELDRKRARVAAMYLDGLIEGSGKRNPTQPEREAFKARAEAYALGKVRA